MQLCNLISLIQFYQLVCDILLETINKGVIEYNVRHHLLWNKLNRTCDTDTIHRRKQAHNMAPVNKNPQFGIVKPRRYFVLLYRLPIGLLLSFYLLNLIEVS